MATVPKFIWLELRSCAVQAGGSPLAGNADFDVTECLSVSMEQGIAEEGQQEHNMMVSAVRHQASLAGCLYKLSGTAMFLAALTCSCFGHKGWVVIRSFFPSLGSVSEVINVCPDEQVTTLDLLLIEHMCTFSPRLVNQLGLAIAHPVVDP